MDNQKSIFNTLSTIDCSGKVEKKGKFSYLSWSWAWAFVKSKYNDASFEVCEFESKPYLFDVNLGYLIKTKVTINGETLGMQLPVMDGANKAQKHIEYTYKGFEWVNGQKRQVDKTVAPATMFDINTSIMRCLVKNLALFGLGLYIYAGEDLPQQTNEEQKTNTPAPAPAKLTMDYSSKSFINCKNAFIDTPKEGEQLFIDKLKSAYTNSAELIDKIQKIKIANKL